MRDTFEKHMYAWHYLLWSTGLFMRYTILDVTVETDLKYTRMIMRV